MRIKLFVFISILYFVILGAFVFHLNNGSYTVKFPFTAYEYTLPIAVWYLLPIFVFFVFAFLHMSFYGFLRYLKYKNFFHDADKFEDFTASLLLEKEFRDDFKTSEFTKVAEFVKSLRSYKKVNNSDKINDVLDLVLKIQNGDHVNLKKYKLDQNNPLTIQNEKNLIYKDINYAYSRIKNKKDFENELDTIAFDEIIKNGTLEQIKSINLPKTQEQILMLIHRFSNDFINLNIEEYEKLINSIIFDEKSYLEIAKISSKKFEPIAIINIFKKLKDTHTEALKAYLFVLADFSMFSDLKNEIGSSDEEVFNDFKIILLAKEENINIDPHHFIK